VRTLLITGGTGNLGSAVVKRLAGEFRCVVVVHGEPKLAAHVESVRADLSNESEVKRAFDQIGELYGLVHLVGGFAAGGAESGAEVWAQMVSLNLTTAVNAVRAALPHLIDGGRIVAISSYVSLSKKAGLAPYIVSKSALNSLIEVLAIELKSRRITANAILPDALAAPEMRERVAESIVWLLSDAAANVTGSLIPMVA
jgi:NAD(P)-dependent dehydrogenase (short-subunit alcohol dehydrogenase family)